MVLSDPRVYGRRWERGDDHALTLVRLGFRVEQNDKGENVLLPPTQLSTLLSRYRRRVRELIAAGRLDERDAIDPSLIYVRRGARRPADYRFVRPGRDPWPDEAGWFFLPDSFALPNALWFKSLADGNMPFSVSPGLLVHDLAHLTELYSHPEIMRQMRLHAARQTASPRPLPDNEPRTPEELRNWILSEWLCLPNLEHEHLIRHLLPQWFAREGPRTLSEGRSWIEAMPERRRLRHIQELVGRAEELLLRHGGGMRDHYNLSKHASRAQIYSRVQLLLEDDPFTWTPGKWRSPGNAIPVESLHALAAEIRVILDMRGEPSAGKAGILDRILPDRKRARAAAEERRHKLDQLLADRAARFETALFEAVRLRITPERVYREARLAPPAPGSATYEYFKSFLSAGSVTCRAFQLDRE